MVDSPNLRKRETGSHLAKCSISQASDLFLALALDLPWAQQGLDLHPLVVAVWRSACLLPHAFSRLWRLLNLKMGPRWYSSAARLRFNPVRVFKIKIQKQEGGYTTRSESSTKEDLDLSHALVGDYLQDQVC